MCGILGVVTPIGCSPGIDRAGVERLRDVMAHRGPDGAGYLDSGNVVLAHRRLAVIDPTPAGHQPMQSAGGSCAIVYNGELYNDRELREELAAAGHAFRAKSDTETILAVLEQCGADGLRRLRGMFALGFHDIAKRRLLLARDPLGVKPLYFWRETYAGVATLIFASEIPAILAHPGVTPRPDLATVSAYLTTIRTTIGERTLFEGVRTLMPGEWMEVDLASPVLEARRGHITPSIAADGAGLAGSGVGRVRDTVESSIRCHLRSDVPVCCLLSGGLDSSIVATTAKEDLDELWTYCSGAMRDSVEAGPLDDFAAARIVAREINSRHSEAPVDRAMFAERWERMVRAMGVPLSTPNEVAIHEVAGRLRADGMVVTISGEGADELFGGYDLPMSAAHEFESMLAEKVGASGPDVVAAHRANFQVQNAAWISPQAKSAILNEPVFSAIEGDAVLLSSYRAEFERIENEGANEHPAQRHLRFQRRVNLAGLLQRLDSATMLASVEGRTPFADIGVARLAESLPMASKFGPASAGGPNDPAARTKISLRRAFEEAVPVDVLRRPKASFPLPFQAWCPDMAHVLGQSGFARELFTEAAVSVVSARPSELWALAWPMINIALWGRRWWG